MKERIKIIVIALFTLFGAIVAAFVASELINKYLPSWVYYSFMGVFIIWFIYEVSKPDKEDDFHKKIQRLNDLTILWDCIKGGYDYDDLKIKIIDEKEKILKSIKL